MKVIVVVLLFVLIAMLMLLRSSRSRGATIEHRRDDTDNSGDRE